MSVIGVIPARLQSSRLPRKLLLNATGKPLIQYAWEKACQSTLLDEVLIATDSPEIADVATGFGAECQLTGAHSCGTDRVAEVARGLTATCTHIVNLQGDEPNLDPASIDALVESRRLSARQTVGLCTLVAARFRLCGMARLLREWKLRRGCCIWESTRIAANSC